MRQQNHEPCINIYEPIALALSTT